MSKAGGQTPLSSDAEIEREATLIAVETAVRMALREEYAGDVMDGLNKLLEVSPSGLGELAIEVEYVRRRLLPSPTAKKVHLGAWEARSLSEKLQRVVGALVRASRSTAGNTGSEAES